MKYLDVAVADAVNERLDRMESIVEVIRLTPDEMSMGTAKGCLAVLSELLSETKKWPWMYKTNRTKRERESKPSGEYRSWCQCGTSPAITFPLIPSHIVVAMPSQLLFFYL
ncbi:hypothetical protein VCSRO161_3004 [Vibrio cholerae]|nr:hypothetical protein VCSRO161_3004 [Vibrio cholerae]